MSALVMKTIDRMMSEAASPLTRDGILKIIRMTVYYGVPMFNSGDHKECAEFYLGAAQRLLAEARAPSTTSKIGQAPRAGSMMVDPNSVIENELGEMVDRIRNLVLPGNLWVSELAS